MERGTQGTRELQYVPQWSKRGGTIRIVNGEVDDPLPTVPEKLHVEPHADIVGLLASLMAWSTPGPPYHRRRARARVVLVRPQLAPIYLRSDFRVAGSVPSFRKPQLHHSRMRLPRLPPCRTYRPTFVVLPVWGSRCEPSPGDETLHSRSSLAVHHRYAFQRNTKGPRKFAGHHLHRIAMRRL
jgi:hypothetical protein